jgi:N-acylneuraminate cytidylyltransferase
MTMVAIITARGGSKRIPGKNIKPFMGKPMIAYAIEACLGSGVFDEVMVSTDSQDIADIALQYGAQVPFMRSAKTSDDFASTFDVLEEVVQEYRNRGKLIESLACLYPCVPFLTSETLKQAYDTMQLLNADALVPVCKYSVPVEWAMKIEEGKLVPNDKAALNIRSQDLIPKYFDAGMFYFIKTDVMLREKTLFPEGTAAHILDEMDVQDIDTMDDWNMAELKYRMRHKVPV